MIFFIPVYQDFIGYSGDGKSTGFVLVKQLIKCFDSRAVSFEQNVDIYSPGRWTAQFRQDMSEKRHPQNKEDARNGNYFDDAQQRTI